MESSGTYLYDGTDWVPHDRTRQPEVAEPWLMLDIEDDTVATVTYRPAGPGTGIAYLRAGEKDESAVSATDPGREADGLVGWWAQRCGGVGETDLAAKRKQITDYLSGQADTAGTGGEMDYSEIYVSLKASRFLVALDLPVPADLLH